MKYQLNKCEEIDGVYRYIRSIPTNLSFVCIYLFKVDDQIIMYDAGLNFKDWKKDFFAMLKSINFNTKIDFCIISHSHIEHLGLIKVLKQEYPDMKLVMHEATFEITKWYSNPINSNEIAKKANMICQESKKFGLNDDQSKRISKYLTTWPKLIQYQKPDIILSNEEEMKVNSFPLKFIWTPGHTIGHICMFDEKTKHFFCGDHILSEITPHIGTFDILPQMNEKYDFSNPLGLYLKSLDKLEGLNPKITFPAHQELIYDLPERILQIKNHHTSRLNYISNLIKDNPMSPIEISNHYFGIDLNEMNYFLALNEIASHLIYLENEGNIFREELNGKYLFYSN